MSRSAALALYLAAARAAAPLGPILLERRARRGKEERTRMAERLGRAAMPRPPGGLVWLHGASVGESLSVLGLIEAIHAARPDLTLLMTTGTVTSAALMAERLPAGTIHQYVPLDIGAAPRRFVEHWRPDLGIWVESELWPALIEAAAGQGARLALINARMSEGSARGWSKAPGMIARLLSRFSVILAQDAGGAERLRRLGGRDVKIGGSLKAGAAPPDRPEAREALAQSVAGRPLWLAASTHEGEEEIAAQAHRLAAETRPGLLCLLAPRHPERGPAIAAMLRGQGFAVSRRAAGEAPGPGDDIHVLDTLGEMGAWLRLAPVAFIGGSLTEAGGHNPYEPAELGCAILHGPEVENFAGEYQALREADGAREAADAAALAAALGEMLDDGDAREAMTRAARRALSGGGEALSAAMAALLPLLPPAGRA